MSDRGDARRERAPITSVAVPSWAAPTSTAAPTSNPTRLQRPLRALMARFGGSIGARIIALCLGLLLVVQLASFTAISESLSRHARNGLPDRLQVGERVLLRLIENRSSKLIEGARILATDYGFRAAVGSDDAATMSSVLANHGARIGATESALLDTSFRFRATSGDDARAFAPLLQGMASTAMSTGGASRMAYLSGKPHLLVLVPMKAPVLIGWVLMGFPVGQGLADDTHSLSALDLTLISRPNAATPWTVDFSSQKPEMAAPFARPAWAPGNTTTGVTGATGASDITPVRIHDEEFGAHATWLTPPSTDAAMPSVAAVISLSIDDAVRVPCDLQLAMIVITVIGFAVFVAGCVVTTRYLTTPLSTLAAAAERLGAGDYATPMPVTTRLDEIGHLTTAFEHMRSNVAEKQQQILQLAYWDPLTKLPNRLQFREAVRDAVADASEGGSVAVIMLDLDRFKHVNDVLGYRFGDLVLTRVAERLSQQSVRGGDLVARLGGDEFAVLIKNGHAELATTVARRIEAAFNEPLTLEEHTVDMGAGIGIACWPQHAADADTLLSRAEVAMYAAKRRTSDAMMYDPSIDAASAQTLSLLTELRQAVGRGELKLYLQPKLGLLNDAVTGAEALLRWQHPQRGLVPPMEFVPFAEQTGFIRTLTIWVFEEAARQWTELHATGMDLTLSVNLSTRDLLDQDLPQKFEALLIKHRVPAEAFCLEITESAIMDDPQRALATLERLSALGFRLSIDDFGTGYSSLAYLKRLPVDELKIDKSFVLGMERDADDAMIVRSTIDLAHNLGLSVVAEGVENKASWDMLRDLHCDHAQGFFMGRPMPADKFLSWTATWNSEHDRRSAHIGAAAAWEGSMTIH